MADAVDRNGSGTLADILEHAEQLIVEGKCTEAIELLCSQGVPDNADVCVLMAKAYMGRGDSHGDLFSARFFAERAIAHGSSSPHLQEVMDACRILPSRETLENPRCPQFALGGWQDTREDAPSRYDFNALSRTNGVADEPKDFDWMRRNVPCQEACPAGTDIPEYLTAIYEGDYQRAYEINLRDNVFPGVLGRVCARPCEAECRHGWPGLGESVAICFSKRSGADCRDQELTILPKRFPDTGKRVAVIGAGVAGLTAARELALCGHTVTVYEKHRIPGGMLNQGIPVFRLPRDVIEREVAQITALGVTIRCSTEIGRDVELADLVDENDAVILAAGTLRPNILDLPGKELAGIRHGLDFLLEVNETGSAEVGEQVVVIGGGFTAMDCARTAKRVGIPGGLKGLVLKTDESTSSKREVKICYRRSINEMLVTPGEIEELEHEGIPMEFMVTPTAYLGQDGHVTHVRFVRTKLGEPDDSGRRRPIPIEGSEFDVRADTILLATGQFPDTSWIKGVFGEKLVLDDGWPECAGGGCTAIDGVFMAGDFPCGANSLIDAIGHAKTTAWNVDTYLMGQERTSDCVVISDLQDTGRIREMDAVPLQDMPSLPLEERDLEAEVETGYDPELAVDEAQRCYRCHIKFEIDSDKCIYCDWCIKVKPRPNCILRVKNLTYDDEGRITAWEEASHTQEGTLIWINQEDCIRCRACVDACPVDAISIQKATLTTRPA